MDMHMIFDDVRRQNDVMDGNWKDTKIINSTKRTRLIDKYLVILTLWLLLFTRTPERP